MLETGKIAINMRLKRRWEEKMQSEHRERVVGVHTLVDNRAPPVYKHMEIKPKRIQLEEGKWQHLWTCQLLTVLFSVSNRAIHRN